MKPADLQPGHRIATADMGTLTVVPGGWSDVGPEAAERFGIDYEPALDRVYIDVEPDRTAWRPRWDPENLPAATGAENFGLLTISPLRYRLAFLPHTELWVEGE